MSKSIKLVGYVALNKDRELSDITPDEIGNACRAYNCGGTKKGCNSNTQNHSLCYSLDEVTPYRVEISITRVRW